MNRDELEGLDRDTLIARAEAAGIRRARVLTKPELVDELLVAGSRGASDATLRAARGLFGRARDLLARVIDRGLHLPEAADLFRGRAPSPPPSAGPAVPTVTLAEIYAAQGHKERAIETLERVLELQPENATALALLANLRGRDLAPPVLPPEGDDDVTALGASEPLAVEAEAVDPNKPFLKDDEPLPPRYDVDECVAIPVDPTTMFVYWEMRERTRAHLEKTRPGGRITLRALVVLPSWDGPRVEVRDFSVGSPVGDWFVRDLPRGAVVRAAVGWTVGPAFVPSAHSPAIETLVRDPSPLLARELVLWTPDGAHPIGEEHRALPAVVRALTAATARAERAAAAGGEAAWDAVGALRADRDVLRRGGPGGPGGGPSSFELHGAGVSSASLVGQITSSA